MRWPELNEEIGIATLDGKAYYLFTQMLKKMVMPFASLAPGEKIPSNINVILTTKREKQQINLENILCIEELDRDTGVVKERILGGLYAAHGEPLVIGVDPGKRIGLVAYYQDKEIESCVLNSVDETFNRISKLTQNAKGKKIVRIGNGSPTISKHLATILTSRLGGTISVELVDERGTSTLSKTKHEGRGTRDEISARLIAHRQGRKYQKS